MQPFGYIDISCRMLPSALVRALPSTCCHVHVADVTRRLGPKSCAGRRVLPPACRCPHVAVSCHPHGCCRPHVDVTRRPSHKAFETSIFSGALHSNVFDVGDFTFRTCKNLCLYVLLFEIPTGQKLCFAYFSFAHPCSQTKKFAIRKPQTEKVMANVLSVSLVVGTKLNTTICFVVSAVAFWGYF